MSESEEGHRPGQVQSSEWPDVQEEGCWILGPDPSSQVNKPSAQWALCSRFLNSNN